MAASGAKEGEGGGVLKRRAHSFSGDPVKSELQGILGRRSPGSFVQPSLPSWDWAWAPIEEGEGEETTL